MQNLFDKSLLAGAAVLLSGCGSSYFGGEATYSAIVGGGYMLSTLDESSTVDGAWTGSMGSTSFRTSATSWEADSAWSGDFECDSAQIEQLGKDLFDSLRKDIFARGFRADTDPAATYLEPYSPGASPTIEIKITHRSARGQGTVQLTAARKVRDRYTVTIAFKESSI
jgi:hypothetical protein